MSVWEERLDQRRGNEEIKILNVNEIQSSAVDCCASVSFTGPNPRTHYRLCSPVVAVIRTRSECKRDLIS
jgi:hypothetical protein